MSAAPGCRFTDSVASRRALAVAVLGAALAASCAGRRGAALESAPPDPHQLEHRSATRLRSASLDISVRYHEGGSERLPFALIRLRNRTRAPIYPALGRIRMVREGEEPRAHPLACDRGRQPFARLAPRDTRLCGDYANPGKSIDLPVALFDMPPEGETLHFDLVVPVVFDSGDPIEVTFGNRVDRAGWELTLSQPG